MISWTLYFYLRSSVKTCLTLPTKPMLLSCISEEDLLKGTFHSRATVLGATLRILGVPCFYSLGSKLLETDGSWLLVMFK